MLIKKLILKPYETNNYIVAAQCKGLTHEDSLTQLPFRGNCLNWVVGHMIASRDSVLKRVGAEPLWSDEVGARYQYNSEPIVSADDPGIIPLDQMLVDIQTGLERLNAAVEAMTEEQLLEADDKGQTTAEWISFMGWHGGYHSGQTEYLRQLAGANDHII